MLSDEEKKAIEYWQYIRDTQIYDGYKGQVYAVALVNLVEKQTKEIEELKEKRQELINASCKFSIDATDNLWKDKIKAKIEELEKEIKVKKEIARKPMDRVSRRLLNDDIVELEKAKHILQSLLKDKE